MIMVAKKMKRRARLACLLAVAAGVVAGVWAQKKVTVPKDFPTIQAALAEAVEGDTVYVRKGVYRENITLSDDVVLVGEDKKATIIDGRRKGPVVTAADGAVITNFTVRNGTTGILCKNTRPIITNNIIIDNKGTGIHALVALPDIVNNVVYRNGWTGIFLESTRGTRTSINHNVIMENGYSGIFGAGRTEVLVRNNILYGNKQYGIFLGPDARKTRVIGNNIYANRLPYNDNADNATVRQQNISSDPQLTGPGFPRHNFSVKSGSPCKGAGEEGADIGLSEQVKAPVVTAAAAPGGPSELDQFFGPSPGQSQDVHVSEPEQPSTEDMFASFSQPAAPSGPAPAAITGPTILYGVNFFDGSADFSPESFTELDDIYARLAYYTDMRVEIAGHTDTQESDDANKSLSHRRAVAVRDYLASKGIPRSRLVARGYGMERPDMSGNTRIEIVPMR